MRSIEIAQAIPENIGGKSLTVPAMIGVDPEMRDWSVFQTLEHNVIVNQSITQIVKSLAKEQPFVSELNPKTDVLPTERPGIEQIEAFKQSVDAHQESVEQLHSLHSRERFDHPVFGSFDAHAWHCMFGFHLWIHRRQMQKAIEYLEPRHRYIIQTVNERQ